MKKKLLSVLFAVVVAASSILGGCGASQETGGRAKDTEQTRESGKTENSVEPLEADKSERLVRPDSLELDYWIEWEYDGSGNQTKGVSYDKNGTVYIWDEYEYNKSGNVTKKTRYGSQGSVWGWIEYEYDKSGNMTKEVEYDSDGSVSWRGEYEYDKSGNQTKAMGYDPDGSVIAWGEYEYDKSGNMTKETGYDSDGSVSWLGEYEYDKSGNQTKATEYDPDGSVIAWGEYEYDKSGNMTKGAEYDSGGSVTAWVEYEYDESHNLTKEIHYTRGELTAIGIPEKVEAEAQGAGSQGTEAGYTNMALFTVGTAEEKKLIKGEDSDSIIIISINKDTGDTKLLSLCRDTYLDLGADSYGKCNEAYAGGGAEQAVSMLNRNLDLDIRYFMSISYTGLIKIIDGLGGVYIDVDTEDLEHINNMQSDIADAVYGDSGNYTPVKTSGNQNLNGLQATAYFFGEEDVYQSAMKQGEVYKAIGEQMKKQELAVLTQVFDSTISDIYTNIDTQDLLQLISNNANYQVVDEEIFPQKEMSKQENISSSGMGLIPVDLEANVVWLHQFLFDDEQYEAAQKVKEISDCIKAETN